MVLRSLVTLVKHGHATAGSNLRGGSTGATTTSRNGHDGDLLQGPTVAKLVPARSQHGLWLLRFISVLRLDLQQRAAQNALHSPTWYLSALVSFSKLRTHLGCLLFLCFGWSLWELCVCASVSCVGLVFVELRLVEVVLDEIRNWGGGKFGFWWLFCFKALNLLIHFSQE